MDHGQPLILPQQAEENETPSTGDRSSSQQRSAARCVNTTQLHDQMGTSVLTFGQGKSVKDILEWNKKTWDAISKPPTKGQPKG